MTKRKHGRPAVQHSYSCTPQHRGTAGTFSCSRQKQEEEKSILADSVSKVQICLCHGMVQDEVCSPPSQQKPEGCRLHVVALIWSCRFGVRGGDVGLERRVVCSLLRTNFIVWLSLIASYIQLAFHPPATQRTEITTQAFSAVIQGLQKQ